MAHRADQSFGRTVRWGFIWGVGLFGLVGAVVGLVLGLRANPATAWFAVAEVGVPAAIVGALIGTLAGLAVALLRAARRSA